MLPRWTAIAVAFLPLLHAFNLDTHAPIYKTGPKSAHFGFSIASHFGGVVPQVLVGAPQAESGQKGTKKAGALFTCPITSSSSDCRQVRSEYYRESEYEKTPNGTSIGAKPHYYLGKNGQLLGASVASQGTVNGSAIVCAPLSSFGDYAHAFGACYMLNTGLDLSDLLVSCLAEKVSTVQRHNDYGGCTQGYSAFMDKDMLATGLVGAKTWTGGVFARTIPHSIHDSVYSKHTMIDETENKDAIRTVFKSHDYVGFSLRVGRFGFAHESGERQTLVSGATRFGQHGAVVVLPFYKQSDTKNMLLTEDHFVLNGTQLGSAFGYSLEVIDLNNDGFDDLLVGSPFERHSDETGQFGGAVHVYFSQGTNRNVGESSLVFLPPVTLRKGLLLSQYGLAIARLGNLDGDPRGFQDFAVGAPFANDGAGAVYIYHGAESPHKLSTKPNQEILPSSLPSASRPWRAFGFSLSSGLDLDGNGYPDLAVGAALSDTVAILRARPVIRILTEHTTDREYTEIDRTDCPKGAKTCLNLSVSVLVEQTEASKLVNLNSDVLECSLEVLEFSRGVLKRGLIHSSSSTVVSWPCGRNAHRQKVHYSHTIVIPKSEPSGDWLNPLKMRFSVKLSGEKKPEPIREGASLPDLQRFPMLDKLQSTHEFTVPFNTRCGDDQVCSCDLTLKAVFDGVSQKGEMFEFNVGDKDHLDVNFFVENKGEKAYNAALWFSFDPEELELPTLERGAKKSELVMETLGEKTVHVKLGNPMQSNHKWTFTVRFKLVRGRSQGVGRPLSFSANVNSTSQEQEPGNNEWSAQLRIIKRAELELIGTSDPSVVFFGGDVKGESQIELEEDIGVMVRHNYTLHNRSNWTLRNITAVFSWPSQVEGSHRQGKWALYLLDIPTVTTHHTDGTVDMKPCSVEMPVDAYVNPVEHIRRNTKYSTLLVQPVTNHRMKRESRPESSPSEAGLSLSLSRRNRIQPYRRRENDYDIDVVTVGCQERTAKCFTVTCLFDFVDANSAPVIDFRARLWNSTFIEDYSDVEYVEIVSYGRVDIDPNQGVLDEILDNNQVSVKTLAYPDKPSIAEEWSLPWWMLAAAVLAGLFIFLLIVLLLCKFSNFFKRKRPGPSLYTAQLRNHEREEWDS